MRDSAGGTRERSELDSGRSPTFAGTTIGGVPTEVGRGVVGAPERVGGADPQCEGRSLHDAFLRVLTDGELRSRLVQGEAIGTDTLGEEEVKVLQRADAERLRRLARFLACHFYRERIVRLFRASRALALARGRDPLDVLDSSEFSALLDSAVLGSPATADAVARLVEAWLLTDLADRPFGADLVRYEGTMFRVEAGPRSWLSSTAPRGGVPLRSPRARIIELNWNPTPLIAAVRAGAASLPEPVREPTRLLIALSPRGRVTAVRCAEPVLRLLEALDGRKGPADAAKAAGLAEADATALLGKLAEIGAVEWRA